MLLRGEVIKVLNITEDGDVIVGAKYYRSMAMFSPLGFEYTFKGKTQEQVKEIVPGFVWIFANEKNGKITNWPVGNEKIMSEFHSDLERIKNK